MGFELTSVMQCICNVPKPSIRPAFWHCCRRSSRIRLVRRRCADQNLTRLSGLHSRALWRSRHRRLVLRRLSAARLSRHPWRNVMGVALKTNSRLYVTTAVHVGCAFAASRSGHVITNAPRQFSSMSCKSFGISVTQRKLNVVNLLKIATLNLRCSWQYQ